MQKGAIILRKYILIASVSLPFCFSAAEARDFESSTISNWGHSFSSAPGKNCEAETFRKPSTSLPFVRPSCEEKTPQVPVVRSTPDPLLDDHFLIAQPASSYTELFFSEVLAASIPQGPRLIEKETLDDGTFWEIEADSYSEKSAPLACPEEDEEEDFSFGPPDYPPPPVPVVAEIDSPPSVVAQTPTAPQEEAYQSSFEEPELKLPIKKELSALEKIKRKINNVARRFNKTKERVEKSTSFFKKLKSSPKPQEKPKNLREQLEEQRRHEVEPSAADIQIGDKKITRERAEELLKELKEKPFRLAEYRAHKNRLQVEKLREWLAKGEITKEFFNEAKAELEQRVKEALENTPFALKTLQEQLAH